MAELLDDLIKVTAVYSTTQFTFSLLTLTSNLAGSLYSPHIWRSKAYFESRGLIVQEDLIRHAGWYAYYLIQNRTFYGHLVTYNRKGQIVAFIADLHGDLLEQHPDGRVRVWAYYGGKVKKTDDRYFLKRMIRYVQGNIIITEDGNVFLLSHLKRIDPLRSTGDVIQAAISGDLLFFLLRDGNLLVEDLGSKAPVKTPLPAIKYVDVKTRIAESVYLRTVDGIEYGFDSQDREIFDYGDGRSWVTLSYNVTEDLKRVAGKNPNELKVVKSVRIAESTSYDPKSTVVDITRSLVFINEKPDVSDIEIDAKYQNKVQTAIGLIDESIALIADT